MAKLINLIPGKQIQKEELEDMDISLPTQLERYLDKTIGIIKRYNLPRKKEQFIMAKLIDGLDMTPQELNQATQKLKKYKIVHK